MQEKRNNNDRCPECSSIIYRENDLIKCCRCDFEVKWKRKEDKEISTMQDYKKLWE